MYLSNDPNRINMYHQKISSWLSKTSLEIYTVDSSGSFLDIRHPRLHQYSFKQNQEFVLFDPSLVEKDSLLRAYQFFKKDFKNYDYIFKITGKYCAPDLENVINNLDMNYDLILQTNDSSYITRHSSELVGLSSSKFIEIISQIDKNFEDTLYNIRNNYRYLIIKPLKLERPLILTGDNRLLENL